MKYNAIRRVGEEYVQRGLFKEWVADGHCYIYLKENGEVGDMQLLATQRILDTPTGIIYFEPYTPAKEIRRIINKEIRRLRSLEAMEDAMARTKNQATLL